VPTDKDISSIIHLPRGISNSKPLPLELWDYEDLFLQKINRLPGQGPNGDCHNWIGRKARDGYGSYRFKDFNICAPRAAFMFAYGVDPFPFYILHSCDNPPCCNEEHLNPGDGQANADDRVRRKRGAAGEKHGMAELNSESVFYARQLRFIEKKTYRAISKILLVDPMTIYYACSGKTWKDVGWPEGHPLHR
jgi:hypothetical protein